MKLSTNKACVSMTQGAAFDLKDQVAKPYPPAMMRSLRGMGTATAASGAKATGLVPSSSTSPRADRSSAKSGFRSADYDGHSEKCNASEEALRMVMYLSCWGPNSCTIQEELEIASMSEVGDEPSCMLHGLNSLSFF